MEAISLSRAEGFIEPYLKGIEAATKMELRFPVTKEKKHKHLFCWCDVTNKNPEGWFSWMRLIVYYSSTSDFQISSFKFPFEGYLHKAILYITLRTFWLVTLFLLHKHTEHLHL